MSTQAIVGFVVAVLVVGGAVWYYTNSSSGGTALQGNETSDENTAANTGSGSLASLFAMSGSYKCAISSRDPNMQTDGVVYVSNGNVRGDFMSSVSAGGQPVEAHMIKSGNDVYVWSDLMPQGIKMNASAMMGGTAGSASGQAFDPNVSVNYDCAPTVVEASLLVPPSNVQFMSI